MTQHWHAIVAIILAIGLMGAVVILAISELDHGTAGHISEAETTLLATVLGAGIGAVATYLGGRDNSDTIPGVPDERELVYRWPEESRLKTPYDQDEQRTQPVPVVSDEEQPLP